MLGTTEIKGRTAKIQAAIKSNPMPKSTEEAIKKLDSASKKINEVIGRLTVLAMAGNDRKAREAHALLIEAGNEIDGAIKDLL